MKRGVMLVFMIMALCACSTAFGFGIRGFVVANGGASGTPATNSAFKLYGTAGQPGAGSSQNSSMRVCSGFWCFGGPRVLAVDPPGQKVPTEFALGPATPNPTRDQARFHLALPKGAVVTLAVYDVGGRQVGDVVSQQLEAGEHDLYWRAPNNGAGVYFVQLATDGRFKAKRTIVMVR